MWGGNLTVQDYFQNEKIDLDFIEQKFEGSYWESALKFVTEKWETDLTELSEKQGSWISKILDDCVEKRIQND